MSDTSVIDVSKLCPGWVNWGHIILSGMLGPVFVGGAALYYAEQHGYLDGEYDLVIAPAMLGSLLALVYGWEHVYTTYCLGIAYTPDDL